MVRKRHSPLKPTIPSIPEAVCQSLRVEMNQLYELLRSSPSIATTKTLLKEIAVVAAALEKCPNVGLPPPPPKYPDLYEWLTQNSNVAAAIKWQFQPADPANAYASPTNVDKVAWTNWTTTQQTQLNQVYLDCCIWFDAGAHQVPMDPNGLTDQPVNIQPNVGDDSVTVVEFVSPNYMWNLYLAHVGFALAVEITQQLPWSITTYDARSLRYLFDSTTMAWMLSSVVTVYTFGTYAVFVPTLRADNLPKTAFAPPQWTYPFLHATSLIKNTRVDTIGQVLDWMRANLAHFFGVDNFGTCAAVWQYRGYPPLSKIVSGTIDSNNPSYGVQHWTLGCHGSVGFLNAVLRVLNIPVQPVWVCGHELAYFMTEGLYLDHGDDPYNQVVKNSSAPILDLLIDEATYRAWFSNDLTVNITDPNSPACGNVGRSAAQFPA